MKNFDTITPGRISDALQSAVLRVKEKMKEMTEAENISVYIGKILGAALPILFSFILSQKALPLSTYPLGLALIAAARGDTVFFFFGTLFFSFFGRQLPLGVGAISLVLLRFIFSKVFADGSPISVKQSFGKTVFQGKKPFCESETLRLATAALAAFTAGMLQIIAGGFSVGDLFGTCFSVLVCPALAYLYTGYFSAAEKESFRYEAGLIALLVSLVFALSDIEPLGISLSVLCASFICILLARCKNPFFACFFGLVSILAADPLLSPAFAVSAAIAAILFAHSGLYAVCIGSISFAAISFFVGGVDVFASFFPEFMVGSALSAMLKKETAEKLLPLFAVGALPKVGVDAEILSYKEKSNRESIQDISESFAALSKTFFDLSDRATRPGIFDMRQICDRVCDRYCRSCSACSLCWERDYAVTLDTLNKISAKMYKNGVVQKSDLPPAFLQRCNHAEKILEGIETENRRVIKGMLREDKTRAFAVDYAVFARVLSEALQKNEVEYAPNKAARDEVLAMFKKIGFSADSVGVYGNRCKKVYAFRLGKGAVQCKAESIKKALSEALGGRMEDPLFEFADGGINMICHAAPTVSVQCSTFSAAGKGGEANGDRVTAFSGKNGYFYALVGDGMGSGRTAAKKSSAAAVFLEKMLRAGNSVSAGIEMLSALARADGEEGFTTLDLFELDTLSGRGSFIKSGAAPSFVKRGSKLFKIRSKTFPLGILENVDAERTTFDCEDGDRIVLLSDGVTEDIEEPLWLCEFLTTADLTAPDAAEKILAEAKKHTLGRDDMTAAVITVTKIRE